MSCCNFVLWVVISKYAHPPGAESWDSMQTTANALQAGDHVVWVGEYNGTSNHLHTSEDSIQPYSS